MRSGHWERESGRVASPAHVALTLKDLCATLSGARQARGCSQLAASINTGIPLDHIEGLETGSIGVFEDQMALLKELRAYADYLGLSGRDLVVALVDSWTASDRVLSPPPGCAQTIPRVTSTTKGNAGFGPDDTVLPGTSQLVTATLSMPNLGRSGRSVALSSASDAPTTVHVQLTPTSQVPAVAQVIKESGNPAPASYLPHPEQLLQVRNNEAGPAWAGGRAKPPASLKAAVWLASALLLLALAALAIDYLRPGLLARLDLANTASTSALPSNTKPLQQNSPTASSKPSLPPKAFRQTSSSATGASYVIYGHSFSLTISASRPCWLEVISPDSSKPVFAGIVQAASKPMSFTSTTSLKVQIGAGGTTIIAQSEGRRVAVLHPAHAPYTMVFSTAP
ncbi:MAG: helix-turn-helix domain-containing protein [Actinobacteria bacterium]|nr:helix-turn-helix domain-containing protein [Actinomycetota bacterium]